MSSPESESSGGATLCGRGPPSDLSSLEYVEESVWPALKRHALGEQSADEPRISGICPICMDDLDIFNLPCGNELGLRCQVLPCGHICCNVCLPNMIGEQGGRRLPAQCHTCRMSLQCRECQVLITPQVAPTRGQRRQLLLDMALTTLEGGVWKSLCFKCEARDAWMEDIRRGRCPPEWMFISVGFVPLIADIMHNIDRFTSLANRPEDANGHDPAMRPRVAASLQRLLNDEYANIERHRERYIREYGEQNPDPWFFREQGRDESDAGEGDDNETDSDGMEIYSDHVHSDQGGEEDDDDDEMEEGEIVEESDEVQDN